MKEKVLDKIQKLLSLATSPNENEARLAAEKANELMINYNLDLQEVNKFSKDYIRDTLYERSKQSIEDKWVFSILQNHFFIQIVRQRDRKQRPDEYYEKITRTYIIGEKNNVIIAKYVYDFLHTSFGNLWLSYKHKNQLDESSKQSYYKGLFTGLNKQLTNKRHSVEQQRGLVLVKDSDLDKFVKELFDKLNEGGFGNTGEYFDKDAYHSGITDGKNIQIRRGVESKSDTLGKKLIYREK